jgi:rubrerythrin
MNLGCLSLKERLSLCRRAATAGVRRLRLLRQRADPRDVPLVELFDALAREMERHLADIGRFYDHLDGAAVNDGADLDRVVAEYFPSLSKGTGEARIDRETGSYWVECLEEESARFYRALAEQAPDERSRAFFDQSVAAQESHLDFIRHVLL